jgi:putative phosphoesterase
LKIALISDVHGNLVALESVLPAIKQADRVICLGDVAAIGPQPKGTIAFLRKVKWPCVLGNADESIAKSQPEDYAHMKMQPEERARMITHDEWTTAELDASDRRFLSRFRPTIEVRAGSHSFLCYHGSPRSNTEQIHSSLSDDQLKEILAWKEANVYAGGHTHAQMVRKFGTSMVINPGSIGLPFYLDAAGKPKNPTWAEYAMLTSTSGDLRVELRRTRYDIRNLREAVKESGMPDPDWWMQDWV